MDFTINYSAKTVNVGNTTYSFNQLNVPGNAKSEEEVKTYLNGIDLSAFAAKATNDADTFTTTNAANTAPTGENSAKIKAEIDALEAKKQENYDKIDKIETRIENLIKKAEDKLAEASKDQEKAIAKHEEESKKAVREELKKYVEANEKGEGMTKDELNQNIKKALPNEPGLADAVAAVMEANYIIDEVDFEVVDLKSVIYGTQEIENQIADKQTEYEQALAAEQAAAASQSSGSNGNGGSSDPIGFQLDGETYDFIVDDGAFDSASDFLGAKDQWQAMANLDTDGDSVVSKEELQKGNIKVVNSKGEVSDLTKFGELSIDLKSYQGVDATCGAKAGAGVAGIDVNDDDNDGIDNQQLLGIFNINVNGQTLEGYNTLDDTDYLNNKFGLNKTVENDKTVDNTKETTKDTQEKTTNNGLTLNETLQGHLTKAEGYEEKSSKIREGIEEEYKNLGFSREKIKAVEDVISAEAVVNAKNFFASLEKAQKEDEEKEKEQQEEEMAA